LVLEFLKNRNDQKVVKLIDPLEDILRTFKPYNNSSDDKAMQRKTPVTNKRHPMKKDIFHLAINDFIRVILKQILPKKNYQKLFHKYYGALSHHCVFDPLKLIVV
jgi:arginine/lysine/ornithine decarboxylase